MGDDKRRLDSSRIDSTRERLDQGALASRQHAEEMNPKKVTILIFFLITASSFSGPILHYMLRCSLL